MKGRGAGARRCRQVGRTVLWCCVLTSFSAATLPGQTTSGALSWTVEAGASASTPFVEDGNGVTTRAGIGPYLGADLSRALGNRAAATIGVRGDLAALRVRSGDRAWRAGTTHRVDLRAGLELAVIPRVTALVSVLAAHATGPADVIPFRPRHGGLWAWGAETGLIIPVDRNARWSVSVAGEASRIAGQRTENPRLHGGTVGRIRLGVRHDVR